MLMDERLARLRNALAEPLPHPDLDELRTHTEQTAALVLEHFATLSSQEVGQGGTRPALEALLREPLPETGQGFAQALADFRDKVIPHAYRTNHPRFLAFVPAAPSYYSFLGDMLCAGTNFFAGIWHEAAGPAQVELIVLDWFKEIIGYPAAAHGILTGGGSEANLTALVTAREVLAESSRQRAVLYVSQQRHWSIDRAAKVIGMRAEQVRPISPMALRDEVQRDRAAGRVPWAVVANGGATNTGAVDPLGELADVCDDLQLWLHVDAAYGWAAALTPEGKRLLFGIERADSVTLDPHKWFAQTYEAGCVLVRDGKRMATAFSVRPDTLQDVVPGHDEVSFADHGIALTRRFRALKIWLSIKTLGLNWFRDMVERCLRLAEFAEAWLNAAPDFEVLCPRQLSIVCFRWVPENDPGDLDRLNLALVERLTATRQAFLASTRVDGKVALRICFVNWRTTAGDVEAVLELLRGLSKEIGASLHP